MAAFVIEKMLRDATLSDAQKIVYLRGITQMAKADGVVAANEKKYLDETKPRRSRSLAARLRLMANDFDISEEQQDLALKVRRKL